jgi:hypothetical protein
MLALPLRVSACAAEAISEKLECCDDQLQFVLGEIAQTSLR